MAGRSNRFALTCAPLLLALSAAVCHAQWIHADITPRGLAAGDAAFKVDVRTMQQCTEFEVVLTPVKGALSPFTTADVHVIFADRHGADVPVAAVAVGRSLVYRFRLAANALPMSRLEVQMPAYAVKTDSHGKTVLAAGGHPVVEHIMGGIVCDLRLQDFLGDKHT